MATCFKRPSTKAAAAAAATNIFICPFVAFLAMFSGAQDGIVLLHCRLRRCCSLMAVSRPVPGTCGNFSLFADVHRTGATLEEALP